MLLTKVASALEGLKCLTYLLGVLLGITPKPPDETNKHELFFHFIYFFKYFILFLTFSYCGY